MEARQDLKDIYGVNVGWTGSAWVSVSFVSALEAVEVGSNEDMNGGRPETQSLKAIPGSGAIEMSVFWEQRTED